MGNSYTRQSSFSDGDTINSGLFNDEYDQLVLAFSSSVGHTHDGSAGEAGAVTVVGPAQDIIIAGTTVLPKTTNAIDLGSSTFKFKDAYFGGNITADGSITYNGNVVLGSDATDTVTINGTIQGGSLLFEGATADAFETTLAIPDATSDITITLPNATDTLVGKATTDTLTNKTLTSPTLNTPTITGNTTFSDGAYNFDIASHDTVNGLKLGGTLVTATAAELNILDGVTSTATEINLLDGVTSTTAELNYVDGVTSNIQTQLGTKLPLAGGTMTGAIVTNSTFDGRDVATDGTKLDTVETNADVTDVTNVTAAGAVMDSEVTNLADVKAFDTTDYATAAQGATANAALPKAGGAMTGAITTNSTFDGRDVATDGSKLDGIATSANNYVHPNHSGDVTSTADGATVISSGAVDIAMLSATGTASATTFLRGDNTWVVPTDTNTTYSVGDGGLTEINFTSADNTKLDGIETAATADQTQSDINALGITATSVDLGNWTITESSGVAYFATGGVNKMKLDASGNLTVVGDITAYGTI